MAGSPQDIYNSLTTIAQQMSTLSRILAGPIAGGSSNSAVALATAVSTLATTLQGIKFVRWQ